ncbi:twin-arginine translocase TatA/TatE family subunit [Pedobacter sp. AW1-32]|uniref:Sec-independent protein translocase subunit TatA/TatB n=1 Tax=Pedobacter sp. AW1-32 TaxID=3383026 RepID=UPI003FF02080
MLNTTIAAMLGTPEIILIVVAILLIFGGKKIPELMRGLGKGVKEFKEGKDGADGDQVDPSNRDKTA